MTTLSPFMQRMNAYKAASDRNVARREQEERLDWIWLRDGYARVYGCNRDGTPLHVFVDDDYEPFNRVEWARQMDEDNRTIIQ